jgi:tRNA/rRNA methyltransferase
MRPREGLCCVMSRLTNAGAKENSLPQSMRVLAAYDARRYEAGMINPVSKSRIPAMVLVRPQMGENIGAAARAMWNFGLDHMRIVAPRDGWPNPAAVAMASGAGRLLDEATTARDRDLTKPVFSPEAAMKDAAARIAAGQRVAVLFGPERAGLENDDIARANAIVSVPVNPAFASLNLAQCVLLMGYEWMRQTGEVTAHSTEMAGTEWATGAEVEHLSKHYEDRMEDAGFFFPEHKATSMKLNLRNMWSRMPLTRADAQMFHGMMRQMVRWKERD